MFESDLLQKLKPYFVTPHKVWDLKDKSKILKLDWNESTIPPSPNVTSQIKEYLDNNKTLNWYPNLKNNILISKISDYVNAPTECISYFSSSDSAHEYIAQTFINKDDTVIMISPTYDNFRSTAESFGGKIFKINLKNKFIPDFKYIDNEINKLNPKMVYLCNPNNPTGTIFNKNELEKLIKAHNEVLFVIDEAYIEFNGESLSNIISEIDNVIITRTFSKAFGLASFRIGYILASEKNIKSIEKIKNPKNIPTLSQVAAIAALEDLKYTEDYITQVNKTKLFLDKELSKYNIFEEVISNGGNFILLKSKNKDNLIKFLTQNEVFVRDLSHIDGLEDFFRITVGNKNQMLKVMEIIEEYEKISNF